MGQTGRMRGALLGLAVGDALGAAVEFKAAGTFPPVTDYRAGGPWGLDAGGWTDDTSMALALADSIVNTGWNLVDQGRRYVRWWRDGWYSVIDRCFDIGNTTRTALRQFELTDDPWSSGCSQEFANGNGSIMRLAPVPIYFVDLFPDQLDELAARAEESSLITHGHEICLSACRYLATILAGFLHGLPRDEVLAPDWPYLQRLQAVKPLHPTIATVAAGSFRELAPPAIRGSGFVVKSLEAALWAFAQADDFASAVLAAVNLGDDADTTGAVCGQLAGAYWGESGIPEHWREELARPDLIDPIIASLLEAQQRRSHQPQLDIVVSAVPRSQDLAPTPPRPTPLLNASEAQRIKIDDQTPLFTDLIAENNTDAEAVAGTLRFDDPESSEASIFDSPVRNPDIADTGVWQKSAPEMAETGEWTSTAEAPTPKPPPKPDDTERTQTS